MTPSVFDYHNYRQFIKDYYEFQKNQKSSFSYQYLATKAGFKSKTSLANITSGIQSLSKDKIYHVARAMKLKKKETEYFRTLVYFNEAKSIEERNDHFERMQSLTRRLKTPGIIDNQYEYYSKWYHGVIRELVTIFDFQNDYKILGNMVEPPITPKMARLSVELLLKLGMIKQSANGLFVQTESMLSSGNEVTTLALQKYHKEHMVIASNSLDKFDSSLREITSVTAGVSHKGFNKIKCETEEFRKRIMEIVQHDTPVEAVYQIALQVYPLSKTPKSWGKKND